MVRLPVLPEPGGKNTWRVETASADDDRGYYQTESARSDDGERARTP